MLLGLRAIFGGYAQHTGGRCMQPTLYEKIIIGAYLSDRYVIGWPAKADGQLTFTMVAALSKFTTVVCPI